MTDVVVQPETNLADIKNKYEALIQKIVEELEEQKAEQQRIRKQVSDIIEENSGVSWKSNISRLPNESDGDREHEQLTNAAISNLKQQVDKLKEERKTFNQLLTTSQETIANLETENQSYKNQLFKPNSFVEIKQHYCKTIKCLQQVIGNQKNEIFKQTHTIRNLTDQKNHTNERVKELQKTIANQERLLSESKRLEESNTALKQELQAVLRANSELKSSTNIVKVMIDERFTREKNALEKLQEALLIAETAMGEKEEALKRELIVKEECETLAKTIGQVMEEAARKVEQDVNALKSQYEKKESYLTNKWKESLAELDHQIKATRAVESRCFALEQKLKDAVNENSRLDRELQVASQTIIEMELQMNATEKLRNEDKKASRSNEEHEEKLRHYIESNRLLKERWKSTIEDLTKQFGREIQRLQSENAHLRSEIDAERQNGETIL